MYLQNKVIINSSLYIPNEGIGTYPEPQTHRPNMNWLTTHLLNPLLICANCNIMLSFTIITSDVVDKEIHVIPLTEVKPCFLEKETLSFPTNKQ